MIVITIDEAIAFWTAARKPDDYGVSVPLGQLRELRKSHDEWRDEAARLAAVEAAGRRQ